MDDYLGDNPTYDEATFRRRFRTSTNVYKKIREPVKIFKMVAAVGGVGRDGSVPI
jgi:hypothetical protein